MKILIASDIHGSAYYCRMLLEALEREKADRLFLLGDILYHGPRNDLPKEYAPKEVIKMLNERKTKIFCVRGNCDTEKIMQSETLEVDKKTKKGITLTNIKPMISSIGLISDNDGNAEYEMVLSAGNVQNLKPETVISAFEKYSDGYKADFISVTRKEMYFDGFKSVM